VARKRPGGTAVREPGEPAVRHQDLQQRRGHHGRLRDPDRGRGQGSGGVRQLARGVW
jgi:hypothetical protein